MTDYWIDRDGERLGPYDESRIIGDFERGLLQPGDRIWTEGLAEPLPLEEVFAELESHRPGGDSFALEPMEELPEPEEEAAPEYKAASEEALGDLGMDRVYVADYAGFWVRFGAVTLDTMIIIVLFLVLLVAIVYVCGLFGLQLSYTDARLDAFSFFVSWFYYAGLEGGAHGATLGKRAFHLKVLRAADLEQFGFLLASARYAVSLVSYALLGIGYLMQPFTPRKQALHDLATGTVVVTREPCSVALLIIMILIGVPGSIAGALFLLQDLGLLDGFL